MISDDVVGSRENRLWEWWFSLV